MFVIKRGYINTNLLPPCQAVLLPQNPMPIGDGKLQPIWINADLFSPGFGRAGCFQPIQNIRDGLVNDQEQLIRINQQAIIAEADAMVQELVMMDPGQKQSILDGLVAEDAVFHAVVVQRLQQAQQNLTAQAKAEVTGQGGGAAPPPQEGM